MLRIFTKLYLLLIRSLFSPSAPSILYVGWWYSLLARCPQSCFPDKWAALATLASLCSSWLLSSLPVELSSRHGGNTGPWVLIPKPHCHISQNSGSTKPLASPFQNAHHIVFQLVWDIVTELKTSSGQFLRNDIQDILWHLPHKYIPIPAPAYRYKYEHICTTHKCTCTHIFMHMCTNAGKKKHTGI